MLTSENENVLLIRWSMPNDMSRLASPLLSAATSSLVSLKPRSAASGFDCSRRRKPASLIARWTTFSRFLLTYLLLFSSSKYDDEPAPPRRAARHLASLAPCYLRHPLPPLE